MIKNLLIIPGKPVWASILILSIFICFCIKGLVQYKSLEIIVKNSVFRKISVIVIMISDAIFLPFVVNNTYIENKSINNYTQQEKEKKTYELKKVNTDNVIIREGASTNYNKIDKIDKGDIVKVINRNSEWVNVEYKSCNKIKTGWIRGDLLDDAWNN